MNRSIDWLIDWKSILHITGKFGQKFASGVKNNHIRSENVRGLTSTKTFNLNGRRFDDGDDDVCTIYKTMWTFHKWSDRLWMSFGLFTMTLNALFNRCEVNFPPTNIHEELCDFPSWSTITSLCIQSKEWNSLERRAWVYLMCLPASTGPIYLVFIGGRNRNIKTFDLNQQIFLLRIFCW